MKVFHLLMRVVDLYKGSFVDDKIEGFGTYVWPSGEEYEGDYKANRRNGKGTYHYPDGSKYKGEFLNDQKHGQGCLTDLDGSILHNGEWKDDDPVVTLVQTKRWNRLRKTVTK